MMTWETRLREWLTRHAVALGYTAVGLMGLFLRYSYLPMLSADLEFLNAPWFEAIKSGGMGAVLDPALLYNYSPLHLYVWTLVAQLSGGFDACAVLKCVCLGMELALVAACVATLRTLLPGPKGRIRRFLGFSLLWLSPVLLWNAAGWAQTDTCYAAFCVLAVLMLMKDRPVWALAMLGVALAWKLQAIFLLPLFVIAWFCGHRRFSLLWFLLVPGIWVLSGLPMALVGASPLYAVDVYLGQAGLYNDLTFNCPNLFALMGDEITVNQMVNGMFSRTGVVLALAVLGGMAVWMMARRARLHGRLCVLLGAWCVLVCVFFLPRMHERYGIVGEVLLACWAAALGKPRGFAYVVLGHLPTLSAYAEYLFRDPFFPLQLGGAMNLVLLALLTWEVAHEIHAQHKAAATGQPVAES